MDRTPHPHALNEAAIAWALARVAYYNPEALRLAAQLFGVAPCPVCDYRVCRCNQSNLNKIKTMGADKEDGVTAVIPPQLLDLIKSLEEQAAAKAYTVYCATVGGVAFNGDPLPTWEVMVADEAKAKVVAGWRAAANATVAFSLRNFLISADKMLVAAVVGAGDVVSPDDAGSPAGTVLSAVPVASDNSATPNA